ncbi:uncharacterized protein C5orf49 homolog isoform X2 [Theropithecus gelada]|uniref:uncharacterized protein C5orf49 homolog isoform X2 n=1 Tax=Theropithecus gelada TaxID=9565 RepID=UPI000DC1B784|nr:uncharacterized protein C5orf49 homolog isoform X2 [Theropithecus gelada]
MVTRTSDQWVKQGLLPGKGEQAGNGRSPRRFPARLLPRRKEGETPDVVEGPGGRRGGSPHPGAGMLQGRSGSPGGGFQATAEHRRWLDAGAEQPEAGRLRLAPGRARRTAAKAGALDGGGMEDDEEETTASTLRGKPRPPPVSAQSAFSYIPPRRLDPKEHSYYYRQAQTGIISLYDCVFKRRLDYDQKLHRDDREHAKSLGLHVNEEERPVGVLTSSVYGKRICQPIEPLNRDFGRVNHVRADFYRKNDIPSLKAPGFGHMAPA